MKIIRISILSTLLAFCAILFLTPFDYVHAEVIPPSKDIKTLKIPLKDIRRFATAIAEIKRFYIEPVDDKTLFDHAIKGMLSNLDPHSSYLSAEDLKNLKSVTKGEFGGIGIEILPDKNGFLKVISPIDDTPAAKVGIKPGDIIFRINGKLIKDQSVRETINMIRGKPGTKLELTVYRKSIKKPLKFKLEREIIKIKTVKFKMLEPSYAYIRIAFFQTVTNKDLLKAISSIKKKSDGHLKGIILDLRNNPGGLLDAAVDVTDTFLDAEKISKYQKRIVYTKGRVPDSNLEIKATKGDLLAGVPMVVLINSGSASASEIVAGALQDYRRAIIMGEKSFGKGSVQTVLPIDYESGIKLTTALYYTPAGRSIQATGIVPDVLVAELRIPKNNAEDILFDPISEINLEGHLQNGNDKNKKMKSKKDKLKAEKIKQTNSKEEANLAHNDYQLYEALNLLKGINALR